MGLTCEWDEVCIHYVYYYDRDAVLKLEGRYWNKGMALNWKIRIIIVFFTALIASVVFYLLLTHASEPKLMPKDNIKYKVNFVCGKSEGSSDIKNENDPYEKEREIAYKYYLEKYADNIDKEDLVYWRKEHIGIDAYDLDQDGEKEILINFATSSIFREYTGCAFVILKRDNIGYKPLGFPTNTSGLVYNSYLDIAVLNQKSYGYYDLVFFQEPSEWNVWKWDSKGYEYDSGLPKVPAPIEKLNPMSLIGYKVNFLDEGAKNDMYQNERKIAYDYYLAEYFDVSLGEEPQLKQDQIIIDIYDLNQDGEKEILAHCFNVRLCGSAGCNLTILTKRDSQYVPLISITTPSSPIILDHMTNGYHDLAFTDKWRGWDIWKWTDKKYDYFLKLIP